VGATGTRLLDGLVEGGAHGGHRGGEGRLRLGGRGGVLRLVGGPAGGTGEIPEDLLRAAGEGEGDVLVVLGGLRTGESGTGLLSGVPETLRGGGLPRRGRLARVHALCVGRVVGTLTVSA